MATRSTRFGSAAIETLLFRLGTDPVIGIPATAVGNRVHKSPVPDDFTHPFLTYFKRGAIDVGPIGRGLPTTASTLTYEVKAVDEGYDTSRIDEAAGLMDAALDGTNHTVEVDGNWYDISVSRSSELEVELPPEENGTVYQHLGGIYDFYVARIG